MKGIDISHWNGDPLNAISQQGYDESDFVIIKASNGSKEYSYTPFFHKMAKQTLADGKLLGAYHYAKGEDVKQEAARFLQAIEPYLGKIVLALDWESSLNPAFATSTTWAKEFMDIVYEKTKLYPILYTGYAGAARCANCYPDHLLWYARYPKDVSTWEVPEWKDTYSTGPWKKYDIWQFTSSGSKLDRNVTDLTKEDWQKLCEGDNNMGHRATKAEFIAKAKYYQGYEQKASASKLESFHDNAGDKNYQKFQKQVGAGNGAQWCQFFVDGVAYEACGNDLAEAKALLRMPANGTMSGYTPTAKSYYVKAGEFRTTPQVGDVVYFYYSSMGRVGHVGIVIGVNTSSKTFTTMEGNTSSTAYERNGGAVASHTYSYKNVGGSNKINGFGRPAFGDTPSSSSSNSSSLLKKGSSGNAVVTLQKMLIACGYSCGNTGADGSFGTATYNALKKFQSDNGLTVDGIYGPASSTALLGRYKTQTTTTNNTNRIKEFQIWINKTYSKLLKKPIAEDGAYGTETRNAALTIWKYMANKYFRGKLNLENYAFGNSCRKIAKQMVIGKGYKAHPTLAILMQGLLACRGNYDYSVDGIVGRGTEACIKWYQEKRNIDADGICGADTWYCLFN